MRRTFWGVLAFILLASLCVGVGTACSGSSASYSVSGDNVNVDSSYSGKQVELAVGQSLVVTLESNITTGYSWSLTENSDGSVLSETGNEYIAPQTTLIGAGGKEEWTFKALKKGTSTISMEYSRPWETDTPPAETFDLTVVVK
jgi:inhibitor of cysteine peptidase